MVFRLLFLLSNEFVESICEDFQSRFLSCTASKGLEWKAEYKKELHSLSYHEYGMLPTLVSSYYNSEENTRQWRY